MANPIDDLLAGTPEIGRTDALVAVVGGEVAIERYGPGVEASTTLRSWSMAKSVLHAAVGILIEQGHLDLDARAPVPRWADPDEPRHDITLRQLMVMRSGLAWTEEVVDGRLPDVVTMVYGNERRPLPDTADWAADRPLANPPGSTMAYSSANSTIVSAIVRDIVGAGDAYEAWLRHHLFEPLGMRSPKLRFDEAGTWLASSFCFCTARDFARFGELYLGEGTWNGQELLRPSWVATAGEETGRDAQGRIHTMHWWRFGDDPWGAYMASGYLGQHIVVVPPLDLVVVRLGETHTDDRGHLHHALEGLIAGFES